MAYYDKIALLILNEDSTQFLVCEPADDYASGARQYLLPGGTIQEHETPTECLQRKIFEELALQVNGDDLKLVGEYHDVSAASPDRDVSIQLYQGAVNGKPIVYREFKALHWIGRGDIGNENVSPIIRHKIIPDLINKSILK